MKRITFALLLLFCATTFAQDGINYKALIKDNLGAVVASQTIDVKFTIIADTGSTDVYLETHTGATTDTNGIVILTIGDGTSSDTFANIDWSSDTHSLKVEIDIEQDGTFVDMGMTQFMSVPYALHAKNGQSSGTTAGDMQYWNGSAWEVVDATPNEGAALQMIGGIPTWVGGIAVPDAPTIGTAFAGDAQASVSFTAPVSDGGSAITGYTATSSPGDFTGTGTSPITVTGLTNGTAYTFSITATNAIGTSNPSSASNSVTPATVPNAPTIGTAVAGNGEASISFIAPSNDGGSPITQYTATSSPGGFTGTLSQAGSGSITVSGLSNGTAYTFSVTATNAIGTSNPSSASNSVTPATVPDAPTIGTAFAGDAQASVSFTAPVSDGGSAITGYTATSSPGDFTGTGTSPITVTGLTNGTAYSFSVTATNAIETSNPSSASNSVTPTVPVAIGDLRAGGVVFWVDSTGLHGLVCAWSDYATMVVWGCFGTDLPNVPNVPNNGGNPTGLGAEIGDGITNTNGILSVTDCPTAAAASAARSLGPEWFLPSAKELNEMYVNKAILEAVPGFNAFQTSLYWSSSEYDNYGAWVQLFSDVSQSLGGKHLPSSVRAVRAF